MQRNELLVEHYVAAHAEWQKQLTALHRVLIEGEILDPPKLKGLLNREARTKERYDAARFNLLGVSSPNSSTTPMNEHNEDLKNNS
jgi:hypothetical protein